MVTNAKVKSFIYSTPWLQGTFNAFSDLIEKAPPKERAVINAGIGYDNLHPGRNFVARSTLARVAGCSVRTVTRAYEPFKEAGLIDIKQKGYNESNIYILPVILKIKDIRQKLAKKLPALNYEPDWLLTPDVPLSNIKLSSSFYVYEISSKTVYCRSTVNEAKTVECKKTVYVERDSLGSRARETAKKGNVVMNIPENIKRIRNLNDEERQSLTAFSKEAIDHAVLKLEKYPNAYKIYQFIVKIATEFDQRRAFRNPVEQREPLGRGQSRGNTAQCFCHNMNMDECGNLMQKAVNALKEKERTGDPFPNPPEQTDPEALRAVSNLMQTFNAALVTKDLKYLGLIGQEVLNDWGHRLSKKDMRDVRSALFQAMTVMTEKIMAKDRVTKAVTPEVHKPFWEKG